MPHPPFHDRAAGRTRVISTSVGELAVHERGDGAPVVLRHGIFFDRALWRHQAAALARSHRVITIDAPGHGASSDRGRRYDLRDDALATTQVLDAFDIEAAVLIGHSWGGMSAVRAAIDSPERVRALALIDTPLEPSAPVGRARYRLLRALVLAVGTPGWFADQVAREMFSDASRRADASLAADLRVTMARARRLPLARAMDAVLVRPDAVLERMGAIDRPILVLAGVEDYVLPASTRAALERVAPHAVVEELPGMHVLPLEQPEAVTDRLLRFLSEIDAS